MLQVTLCKRRGGLFKKANDLSKLCGVEIAVLVLQDKKTSEFVSTDLSRILHLSRDMQSGGTGKDASETAQLWEHLESQRRELEALRREVAAEKLKASVLRGSNSHAIQMEEEHEAPLSVAAATGTHTLEALAVASASGVTTSVVPRKNTEEVGDNVVSNPSTCSSASCLASIEVASAEYAQPSSPPASPAPSEDTADIDSEFGGTCEPASKRVCLDANSVKMAHSTLQASLESAIDMPMHMGASQMQRFVSHLSPTA